DLPADGDVELRPVISSQGFIMPDPSLLETFPSPTATPFVIEHVSDEFTSVCPKTGHPDFGTITLRYCPDSSCVELKSLKLYYQSFRNEGIYYEAVTNRLRDDLVAAMQPRWLQVTTDWTGSGGIRSRIIATHGAPSDGTSAALLL